MDEKKGMTSPFRRLAIRGLFVAILGVVPVVAQTPRPATSGVTAPAEPAFDVASVKTSRDGDVLGTARFDIQGTFPPNTPEGHVLAMIRSLLQDRFRLQTHLENRDTRVYALMPSGAGRPATGLTSLAPNDCILNAAGPAVATGPSGAPQAVPVPPVRGAAIDDRPPCGVLPFNPARIVGHGVNVTQLVGALSHLRETEDVDRPAAKLKVLVVDRIDRPSEN